jgi:beta-lactam-binding protein with PASTA domain
MIGFGKVISNGTKPVVLLRLLVLAAVAFSLSGCSKKEQKVLVPNLLQQDLVQAEQTLAAVPLKTGNISGASGTVPPGAYVVSQTPAAGQQVAANSAVDLGVELPIAVPNLTGSNVTDAVSLLQGLGLRVAFVKKSTANPLKGLGSPKVEEQNPLPNSPVRHEAIVTLTLTVLDAPGIGALLGLVSKEPAYQNLKPEYKNVLDAFLGNPSTPRSMEPAPDPPTK